jgi:prepilin-type N-terminal cleavage/methylation domain-containing protein
MRRIRAGFTLLELLVVIAIIGVIAVIAIPNLLESRKLANETSAIGSLRSISTAQELYRTRAFSGTPVPTYATTFDGLVTTSLLAGFGQVGFFWKKDNYAFAIRAGATDQVWEADATPLAPGTTGNRSFYIDQTGVIRYTTVLGITAGPTDTPLQ